jgi:hypothetical protein
VLRLLVGGTQFNWRGISQTVRSDVLKEPGEGGGSNSDPFLYGGYSASWLMIFDFLHESGLADCSDLQGVMRISQSSGWWIPREDVCILSRRHSELHLDVQERPHHPKDFAVRYPDGHGVCAWHGTLVPKEWILYNTLTPDRALYQRNVELRRAACEILGWDKILDQLGTKIIDRDRPEIGTLLECRVPSSIDNRFGANIAGDIERFLRVRCGTGRTFVIPVPQECKTAREANAWTYGLTFDQFNPEVRT